MPIVESKAEKLGRLWRIERGEYSIINGCSRSKFTKLFSCTGPLCSNRIPDRVLVLKCTIVRNNWWIFELEGSNQIDYRIV